MAVLFYPEVGPRHLEIWSDGGLGKDMIISNSSSYVKNTPSLNY